jgi:hypothetical protein
MIFVRSFLLIVKAGQRAACGRPRPVDAHPRNGPSISRESYSGLVAAGELGSMRVLYVGLSVRDARRSARCYRKLFGMETVRDFASSIGRRIGTRYCSSIR